MVQGLLGSNFSQILSPLSLMYSAVCRGLSPVCSSSESLQLQKYDLVTSMGRIRWECWLCATQSSDARDITWLATTYFELVSSACFFSVDRVVNSKYRRIILCLVQKHCFVMHHWAIFNRTESQILYTSDCILLDNNGIKNGPRRVGM